METKGYYGIIQYCPDHSRAEGANVGVFLFCPEQNFLKARTASGNDRLRRFFKSGFNPSSVNAAKRAIENRINSAKDWNLDDLNQFIATRANEMRIIPPRPMKVRNPEEDLDALFRDFVGGRVRSEAKKPLIPELHRLFHEQRFSSRAILSTRIVIPKINREISVPYAFKNGLLNLIKPQAFSPEEPQASMVAERLAVEGDLLHKYTEPGQPQRKLIVVSKISLGSNDVSFEDRVESLLADYNTEFVRQAKIAEFVERVQRELAD